MLTSVKNQWMWCKLMPSKCSTIATISCRRDRRQYSCVLNREHISHQSAAPADVSRLYICIYIYSRYPTQRLQLRTPSARNAPDSGLTECKVLSSQGSTLWPILILEMLAQAARLVAAKNQGMNMTFYMEDFSFHSDCHPKPLTERERGSRLAIPASFPFALRSDSARSELVAHNCTCFVWHCTALYEE
jgi:hypothetical protein